MEESYKKQNNFYQYLYTRNIYAVFEYLRYGLVTFIKNIIIIRQVGVGFGFGVTGGFRGPIPNRIVLGLSYACFGAGLLLSAKWAVFIIVSITAIRFFIKKSIHSSLH